MTLDCRPLALPRLSPEAVAARNRFFRARGRVRFTCNGQEWTCLAVPGPAGGQWRVRVECLVAEHPVLLYLDSPLLADWQDSGLDMPTFLSLPAPLQAAAVEVTFGELVNTLSGLIGRPVTLDSIDLKPEETWFPDDAVPLLFVRGDGQRVSGALAAYGEGFALLAEAFERHAVREPGQLGELRLSAPLLLYGYEFSPLELAAVETGDILLARVNCNDGGNAGGNAPRLAARLCLAPGLSLPVSYDGATAVLEEGVIMDTEHTVSGGDSPVQNEPGQNGFDQNGLLQQAVDEASKQPDGSAAAVDDGGRNDPAQAVAVNELPLPLVFRLGSLSLSIAEIGALAPGPVFTLDNQSATPVDILVSGRRIGAGSLVDVGGRIGVQVAELFLSPGGKSSL